MSMWTAWAGMAGVLGALGGLFVVLRLVQGRFDIHPELTRKGMHVGMGVVVLSFPWVFDSAWPVIVLAATAVVALLAIRVPGVLHSRLGNVLGGVQRTSLGEIYFPVGVAFLFTAYTNLEEEGTIPRSLCYCIPVLYLAVADATAALVGVRYGLTKYAAAVGTKSIEGSVAFFITAFLSTYIPLSLWSACGRTECLLIGLLLGLLGMMFEAIAWRGLDNLILPLMTFLLLRTFATYGPPELAWMLLLNFGLAGFAVVYKQFNGIDTGAALSAALVGYFTLVIGGWPWLLPPLIVFVCFPLLVSEAGDCDRRRGNVRAILSMSVLGLLWLFLATVADRSEFLYAYAVTFAVHFGILVLTSAKHQSTEASKLARTLAVVAVAWLLVWLPLAFFHPIFVGGGLLIASLVGTTVVVAAVGTFARIQPRLSDVPADAARWIRQVGCAAGASCVAQLSMHWSWL